MVNRLVALICFLCMFSIPLVAVENPEDNIVRPVRIDTPPRIDGLLNETIWKEIDPITDFRQFEPDNGSPATERTEVRVCYDNKYLYIAVRAFDSDPGKIIARAYERDSNIDIDDTFTVAIDSLDDNRSAFAFDTNVLGTQLDVQYSESGGYNESWDAIWYSRGNVDEQGYTLEFAIPFFVLRFKPSDEVRMGILFERIIQRKHEQLFWPAMSRDYDFVSVSQYGAIEGLKGISRGVDLETKPYFVAGYSKTPGESEYTTDAGLDLKWGVTSNLTADLTLNPDFAQVESDALKVNLTRFGLFFPEKRDFFIESADLFQFGLKQKAEVFFSRRIGIQDGQEVPIIGGARTYGMIGNTNIGVMTIQTKDNDGFEGENFSVARVKHNVFGRSYIGGIVTSRKGTKELEDTTVGGDVLFLFGKNVQINGSVSKSGQDGVTDKNWMTNIGIRQNTDLYDWYVLYDDIGANFDPGIGFILRPDQKTISSNAHYKPRPNWKGIRQLYFGNYFSRTENHAGIVETRVIRPGFLMITQSRDQLMLLYYDTYDLIPHAFEVAPGVVIPAGEYDNRQASVQLTSSGSRRLSFSSIYKIGSFYDGDIQSLELSVVYKPLERLHLSFGESYDSVDLPGGNFNSAITTIQASFHFSPSFNTRIAGQYSSLLEDFVLNARMRWIYAPGSEAWLVYDEGRRFGTPEASLRDQAIILKLVHNFNF